jgi:peptidoglycan hydrolase CwlO-like protein
MKIKKVSLSIVLVSVLMVSAVGSVVAHPNQAGYRGDCRMQVNPTQLDEKTKEQYTKYNNETEELRKKMFSLKAEMRAVMNSQTPDSKEAGRLAAEMFDIKEHLKKKAEEIGLESNQIMPMWHGGAMMGNGMNKRFKNNSDFPCNQHCLDPR